ncbi:MAG: hypothetical protein LBJ69_01760 [Holosporales bacterium]|jgi:hypothetical protein|nr:hypothetical protein [Holosporales bacterium]
MKSKLLTSTLILGLIACEAWSSREREREVKSLVERTGEVIPHPSRGTLFETMEFLQQSINEMQQELLKLKQSIDGQPSIEIPSSITTEDIKPLLEPITGVLNDEGSGLAAIHSQATAAASNTEGVQNAIGTKSDPGGQDTLFGKAIGTYAAVTSGATGLVEIHARADAAADSARDAYETLTTGNNSLAKIKEATGSIGDAPVADSSTGSLHAKARRLMDLTGKEGDQSSAVTLFGRTRRIADDTAKISDGAYGLLKIKGAVGSEDDTAATAEDVGSLHAKVRRLQATVAELQQLIGTPEICLCREPPATVFGSIRKAEATLLSALQQATAKIVDPNGEGGGDSGSIAGEVPEPYLCPVCQQKAVQAVNDAAKDTGFMQDLVDWLAENLHQVCDASGLAEACPYGSAHIDSWYSQPISEQNDYYVYIETNGPPEATMTTALFFNRFGDRIRAAYKQTPGQITPETLSDITSTFKQAATLALAYTTARVEITIAAIEYTGYLDILHIPAEGTWLWRSDYDYGPGDNESAATHAACIRRTTEEALNKGCPKNVPTSYISYTRPPLTPQ